MEGHNGKADVREQPADHAVLPLGDDERGVRGHSRGVISARGLRRRLERDEPGAFMSVEELEARLLGLTPLMVWQRRCATAWWGASSYDFQAARNLIESGWRLGRN